MLPIIFFVAAALVDPSPSVAAEVDRLAGQRYTVADDGQSYTIDDIAGEGVPFVGIVQRREESLWLVIDPTRAMQLTGPLAVPRIAGPGYKVWVVGTVVPKTGELRARRLGVLAPPQSQ
jgi:hypothetical protein